MNFSSENTYKNKNYFSYIYLFTINWWICIQLFFDRCLLWVLVIVNKEIDKNLKEYLNIITIIRTNSCKIKNLVWFM